MCIRDRRIIELFTLRSSYDELKERLELKEIDDYFDDTFINDKNLPYDVMSVVEEYDDKITYLMLTKNTDGDRTKITNVDRFYELMVDKNVVNYSVDVINESSHYNNNNRVTSVSKDDNYYIKV